MEKERMMTAKYLPVGDSSFRSIRENGYLYVDKTRHFFELARRGKYYFLSRPRRFGKSLTVSALKHLFQGRKELFEGLWIAEHGNWEWKEHPVVIIDFNQISHQSPEILRHALSLILKRTAQEYGVQIETDLLEMQFLELITGLEKETGATVAVLVDEYDKPIISHLGKGEKALEIAKENREIMKYFFGVLKGADVAPCLRFVFFTGVSKFSRVSIFSELNNLEDISMTDDHADMLGYTQAELERYFSGYISEMAKKHEISNREAIDRLAAHYDGYRFSNEEIRVYNPFSVMSALKQKAFKNYWFETGTPTFLVDLLRERQFSLPRIENLQSDETVFSTYEPENLKPEAILFQTGYITIKDVEDQIYTFDYPNKEVKTAFLKHLLATFIGTDRAYSRFLNLSKHLREERFEAFFETIRAIFAAIPYPLQTKRDEAYYHTVFYLMVSASGVDARSEVLSCRGRIDLVVEFADKVYIIEFKCGQGADAALGQIREKGYPEMFRGRGKKILLMGIDFDPEERNVAEWKWKEDDNDGNMGDVQ